MLKKCQRYCHEKNLTVSVLVNIRAKKVDVVGCANVVNCAGWNLCKFANPLSNREPLCIIEPAATMAAIAG